MVNILVIILLEEENSLVLYSKIKLVNILSIFLCNMNSIGSFIIWFYLVL